MTNIIATQLQERRLYAAQLALNPNISALAGREWRDFLYEMKLNIHLGLVRLQAWDQYIACCLHDALNP